MRVEQEHVAKLVHVTDVRQGDLIDTEGWWPEDHPNFVTAENLLFEVFGIEIETDDCVRIDFEGADSYGWPMNKPIVVQRRLNR